MKLFIIAILATLSLSAQHYAPVNDAVDSPSSPVNSAVGY